MIGGNTKPARFQRDQQVFPGLYRASVVDNNDPDQLCRLKVKVFDLYRDIPPEGLPWAWPCYPDGGGNDYGHVFIPEIGSTVWVMFEQGNVDRPVWMGTFYGSPEGQKETPAVFRGDPSDPAAQDSEPLIDEPSSWAAEYPKNRGIRTKNGIVIEYDDTDGAERIHLYHPSGSHMEFRANGDVVLHVVGDYHVVVDGDVEEYYKQNHHQEVDEDQLKEIHGSREETIDVDKTLEVLGEKTEEVVGPVTHQYLNTLTETVVLQVLQNFLNTYTRTVTLPGTENYQATYTRAVTLDAIETYLANYTKTVNLQILVQSLLDNIRITNETAPEKKIFITAHPDSGQIILSAGGDTSVIG